MNSETLAALRGSIAKWQAIVDGTGKDNGAEDCPLCALFFKVKCQGCPVALTVRMTGCYGTPYFWYRESESQEDAQAELDFLISLLPKGETL